MTAVFRSGLCSIASAQAREAALIAEAWTRACAEEIEQSPDLNTAVKEILEEAARRWTI